jgi:5-methylcytosine-specific restriction endonuclease McrA
MQKKRYESDPAKHRAYYNKYLADAAPKWLTDEHRKKIQWFYSEARRLGLTVDHIWPLRGKNSCGLHVPWNLQLLSSVDNDKKGNMNPIL